MDTDNIMGDEFQDLISDGIEKLGQLDIESDEYGNVLERVETLQSIKNSASRQSSEIEVTRIKAEADKAVASIKAQADLAVTAAEEESRRPGWADRALQVGGLLAPFVSIALMIWWDRNPEGGHIPTQFINPILRSGDSVKHI